MIKKILDWILGKNNSGSSVQEAPYKLETPKLNLDPLPPPQPMPVIEASEMVVKAKYKRPELVKLSKKELISLVEKHQLEVKSRSTKDELIKALLKV